MPNINSMFPSNYLKADDIKPRGAVDLTVKEVKPEKMDGEDKWILMFHEAQKGLVLNKTNAMMIGHTYGVNTDDWIGRTVQLYVEPVQFQGRIVDAIRVRIPQSLPESNLPPAAPQAQQATTALPDDDIPF